MASWRASAGSMPRSSMLSFTRSSNAPWEMERTPDPPPLGGAGGGILTILVRGREAVSALVGRVGMMQEEEMIALLATVRF